ncbi:MAG: dienelactone hydrolase family protein [Alphaproteobacteria bacterium]|nr:dienelactone hydrolase family protein [Alphaproteobacteria bacterium]
MGTRISFPRVDGKKTEGYLAKAGNDHAPAVVVIQEWWGLQDQIKGICDRFALAGYDALAPDLYAGTVVPYHDAAAAMKEMQSLNFQDAFSQVVRGAAQYLLKSSPKVGITGFCMGGTVTILSAAHVPEFSAAVPFYGMPPAQFFKPSDLKIPLQGHFSNHDDYPSPAQLDEFEVALKAAGIKADLFRYDAHHAFMNEQRDAHDRATAELAWGRMLGFFKYHLAK